MHPGRVQRWARRALFVAVTCTLSGLVLVGQNGFGQDELTRKVKTKVVPAYPDLARQSNIRGKVKLAVVVSPNGFVKDAKAVGGNPVLVKAALDAVKRWQFEPSAGESTGAVEFFFEPPGH